MKFCSQFFYFPRDEKSGERARGCQPKSDIILFLVWIDNPLSLSTVPSQDKRFRGLCGSCSLCFCRFHQTRPMHTLLSAFHLQIIFTKRFTCHLVKHIFLLLCLSGENIYLTLCTWTLQWPAPRWNDGWVGRPMGQTLRRQMRAGGCKPQAGASQPCETTGILN